jgi:hypothetical protein
MKHGQRLRYLRDHEGNGRVKFGRRALSTGVDVADLRDWVPDWSGSPEELASAKEQVQAIWKPWRVCRKASAQYISAAPCGGLGPSGNRGDYRNEGRNGTNTFIPRPPVGAGQARGTKMNQHLSSERISNYLMGEATIEKTAH